MTTQLRLRDYQREAIDALFRSWADGTRRPAVVLPTGAGKTVIFSALIEEWRRTGKPPRRSPGHGDRVIVLVHRDELADQAIAKIKAANPSLNVGKVKAQDNDIHADVVVCSVQTLAVHARRNHVRMSQYSKRGERPIGLIITDECHHAAAASYQKIYDAFPEALHAGFTATMARGDKVGLGSVWDDVVYSRSLMWMVKHGYLVSPRAYAEDIGELDLNSVKRSGGDYQAGDLGRALEESDLALSLPAAHKERAGDRPTIVFTPTVATAQGLAEAFNAFGTPAAALSGETPRDDRLSMFEDFRTGRTRVLVNCMVLTEGFDAPWASCAVIARPTQSQPLYVQMVGRVLRPWHGKSDALILNVGGAGGKICTLIDLEPGAVTEIKEGETLLEAEEREEEERAAEREHREVRARQIGFIETDLFAASHTAWLSTHGGVQFLPAGEYTWFLWPSRQTPGTWDVCWMGKTGLPSITDHQGLSVEMAMVWAETEAEEHGTFSLARTASWRKGKPSEAQLNLAGILGIETEGMNKAQLSDAISVFKTSRRIDPNLAKLRA